MKRSITNYGQKKGDSTSKLVIPLVAILLIVFLAAGVWKGWLPGNFREKLTSVFKHPPQSAQPAKTVETPVAVAAVISPPAASPAVTPAVSPAVSPTAKPRPAVKVKPTPVPTVDAAAELDKKLQKQLDDADHLISQNRGAHALSLLQGLVEDNKTHPKAAIAQLKIAGIYEQMKDYEQANKEYEFLIRLFPKSAQSVKSQINLALNTEKLGDAAEEDKKKEIYDKAIELCRQMFAEIHPANGRRQHCWQNIASIGKWWKRRAW